MRRDPVYLDYNATCPVLPSASEALIAALARGGNPSSVHGFGRAARAAVEQARRQVAELVGAAGGSVIFTSGASEANVLALRGLPAKRILTSPIEHDSVLNAVADAIRLDLDQAGGIDLDALQRVVREGDLVSIMAVNNETGCVQPLSDCAEIIRAAGAWLHVDAVQAAGRIPLDFRALGAAAFSISAHKIGGPPGVGALIVDQALSLTAQTRGGGQERGRRGGTENMPGIAGFGAAADHVRDHRAGEQDRLSILRDGLETRLTEALPTIQVIGRDAPRVGNTSCLALPGIPAEKQVIALDLAGFAVSAGSACSSGKVKASHVLHAMGLPDSIAGSAIRVSLGWQTSPEDMQAFTVAYLDMAHRLMRQGSG